MTSSESDGSVATSQLLEHLDSVLFTEEGIRARVAALGKQITRDYQGRDLALIGILKGGIIFLADLSREIDLAHEFDMVGAQSYKGGTQPTRDVVITKDLDLEIEGRDVLIIEDIYDTGNTLRVIQQMLDIFSPRSIEVCALLAKNKDRKVPVNLKYVGFEIDDVFVVGYGLDYKERYRNLKCIGVLNKEMYQ